MTNYEAIRLHNALCKLESVYGGPKPLDEVITDLKGFAEARSLSFVSTVEGMVKDIIHIESSVF